MTHIYLIDDNEGFRTSTQWILEAGKHTVYPYASAVSFIADIDSLDLHLTDKCIVTDIRMPDMSGLQLIEALHQRNVSTPVIVITGHGDVDLAVQTMKQGAASFIEKPFEPQVFLEHIKQAIVDPGAILRNPKGALEKLNKLTQRERQILDLVCQGKLNKSIADILGISIKTVEFHRSKMSTKLETNSIQDLVKLSLGYK